MCFVIGIYDMIYIHHQLTRIHLEPVLCTRIKLNKKQCCIKELHFISNAIGNRKICNKTLSSKWCIIRNTSCINYLNAETAADELCVKKIYTQSFSSIALVMCMHRLLWSHTILFSLLNAEPVHLFSDFLYLNLLV